MKEYVELGKETKETIENSSVYCIDSLVSEGKISGIVLEDGHPKYRVRDAEEMKRFIEYEKILKNLA